jgi:hypothetical protein
LASDNALYTTVYASLVISPRVILDNKFKIVVGTSECALQ